MTVSNIDDTTSLIDSLSTINGNFQDLDTNKLDKTAKAADSDKLDGQHASYFQRDLRYSRVTEVNEFGADGTTPTYFDLHTEGGNDYDARIIRWNASHTNGGKLQIINAGAAIELLPGAGGAFVGGKLEVSGGLDAVDEVRASRDGIGGSQALVLRDADATGGQLIGYSDAANAKPLHIGATTDDAGTAPSAGENPIVFSVRGTEVGRFSDAGNFITQNLTHLGGEITASSAKLQVNGFQRTGSIFLHEGQTPSASSYGVLDQVSSTLRWEGNEVWHTGNDGSGSGLDADKLDGLNSDQFLRSDSQDVWDDGNARFRMVGYNGRMYLQAGATGTTDPAPMYLTGYNGGKMPELRVESDVSRFTGIVRVGDDTGSSGGDNNLITTGWASAWLNIKGGAGRAKMSLGNDAVEITSGSSSISFNYGATSSTDVGTEGGYMDASGNFVWHGEMRVGGITTFGAVNSTNEGGEVKFEGAGTNPDVSLDLYQDQIRFMSSDDPGNKSLRCNFSSGSLVLNGNTVWHAGNDGSGSGLDADKLDGKHASSFMRSDVDDTKAGALIFGSASDRKSSLLGVYDATQQQQIWAMGSSYQMNADGTPGSHYGLAYSYNPDYGATGNNPGAVSGLNHQLLWRQGGTVKCAFGAGIWTSGDVTAYSDIRVKTDIEPIEGALDKVLKLQGVTFRRTDHDDTNSRHMGFIAQWVEEVEPLLVHTNQDEMQSKSVRYQNTVALLVEAIKEQQKRIEALEAKLGDVA